VGDAAGIERGFDDVRPGEMVGAGEEAGDGGAIDVLNVIRIVVTLGKSIQAIDVIGVILVVVAGGPSATGADNNEIAAVPENPAYLLVGRALESGPIRGGNAALPGGNVDPEGSQLLAGRTNAHQCSRHSCQSQFPPPDRAHVFHSDLGRGDAPLGRPGS